MAGHPRSTKRATVVVGVASLAVIFGLRALAPRVPGALVLVVGGLLATSLFDLARTASRWSATCLGACRISPSRTGTSSARTASTVVIAAVALVLIGFSQTAGDSREFAAKHHYRIDINQESVAQGMSNVGAGLFQGMPVSTSLSASSLNDHSGARTGLAR